MLKVPEAALLLRVCTKTIYRMVKRGELPGARAGRALRIPESAVMALISTEAVAA